MAVIARLAAQTAAPVFPVVGAGALGPVVGAREAVDLLGLDARVDLVDSPRHATILLVAGTVPEALAAPLRRVHDQVGHPRATVHWRAVGAHTPGAEAALPVAAAVDADDDPVAVARRLHADLLHGRRASADDLLPDEPPSPWEGEGPHGQGGMGMMGGTPYGRPMAMTADDRDGLALDPLAFPFGPFQPVLPTGLTLDVVLQGDVLQQVGVRDNPFPPTSCGIWAKAVCEPVAIRDLEVARARHHLVHVARLLRLHGLTALGRRTLRLATTVAPGDQDRVRRLDARLRRLTSLRWATESVGVLPADLDAALAGPDARAAGRPEDVRADDVRADDVRANDAGYRDIGFAPVTHDGGDAWARWRQRLAEAVQALDLAARAGDRTTGPGPVESPWGRLDDSGLDGRVLPALPRLLEGMEVGDAVTTIASLDLDLEALTLRPGIAAATA